MADPGDFDPWDVFDGGSRRAAKEHRCGDCRRTITKGETYWYGRGLIAGHWYTHRLCAHCNEAARWITLDSGAYGFGEILSELAETFWDIPSLPLGRIVAHMRRQWRGVTPADVRALVNVAHKIEEVARCPG